MARRLGNPLALGALVASLAGCGSGVTFGVAPGPAELPTTEEPPPERDAGPPPPPPDAGENCEQVELPPPDEAESLAEFTRLNVAAGFSCATCHRGRSPEGTGLTWGASTDDVAGWHAASASLASRAVEQGHSIEQSSLYRHFNGSDGTHPENATARDASAAWLTYLWEPRYELVCDEPGPDAGGDCTPVPVDEAQSFANWEAEDLTTVFASCVACHSGNGRAPDLRGSSWGAATNDAAGWHEAAWTLAGAQAGTPVAENTLYTHLNGSDGLHAVRATERDRIGAWLEYIATPQPPAGCE